MSAPPLPHWPAGTVAMLATAGDGGPHVIPVSAVLRDGDRRLLLGLAARRGSLRRLRAVPRVAVLIMAADVAVSAHGVATVLAESLPGAPKVAGVAVDVDDVCDHDGPAFAILGGLPWEWTDDDGRERDAATRAGLATLLEHA